MSSPETAPSGLDPEGAEPFYLFRPNENLTSIIIQTNGFPLWRLKHLQDILLPVKALGGHNEGAPTTVVIKAVEIAEALQFAGKDLEAQWWHGLSLGLSEPYNGAPEPTVMFDITDGTLSELPPDITA